jgi:hypothetical protein
MQYKSKYDTNFTARGLLYIEFRALNSILLSSNFNELIKTEQEENNVIGIATYAARKRAIQEIRRRYKTVPIEFWSQFFEWEQYEQKLALFYLCLKTYPIVLDIHIEVAMKKFKTGGTLDAYDIQMRMEEIMSYDDTVASWSESTLKKINVQYRKVLKDIDMYNGKILNTPEKASPNFWTYFKQTNEQWFINACFIENA